MKTSKLILLSLFMFFAALNLQAQNNELSEANNYFQSEQYNSALNYCKYYLEEIDASDIDAKKLINSIKLCQEIEIKIENLIKKGNCEQAKIEWDKLKNINPKAKKFELQISNCKSQEKESCYKSEQQVEMESNFKEIKFISGRIVSEKGEPIDSVSVVLSDLNERAFTDNNGSFYFDINNKGLTTKQNVKIDIFKFGYKFKEINKTLNGSGVISDAIKLEKDEQKCFYIQVNNECNRGVDNAQVYCNIGECEKINNYSGFYKIIVTEKDIQRFLINISKPGYLDHTENDISLEKILLNGIYKVNLRKLTIEKNFNFSSLLPGLAQLQRGDKIGHLFLWSEVVLIPSAIVSWCQYDKYKELSKGPSRNQSIHETNRDMCLGLGIATTALAVGFYAWNIIDGNTNKEKKMVFMPYVTTEEYGVALSLKF